MDGPRACRVEELPALRELENTVFRSQGGDMFREYPHIYGEHNVENLRIIADGERVVSCVGMVERWAAIEGCAISCTLIGGVGTHPDYRQRGLATACLRDALAKARADGVELAFISGGRGLYQREGARPVGRRRRAMLDSAVAERYADPSLHVTLWDPERDMAEVAAIYRREPVRWLRPLDDYRFFARSGWVLMRPCVLFAVRRDDDMVAYLVASEPDEDGCTHITEYAGERAAVAGSFSVAMRARGARGLAVCVADEDGDSARRLGALDAELTPAPPDGTVLIVNFPSLMERLRSRFAGEVGVAEAARFAFREEPNDDGHHRICIVERDGAAIARLDRADMVRALFGDASDGADAPPADLTSLLPSGPVPLPQYGLNYG